MKICFDELSTSNVNAYKTKFDEKGFINIDNISFISSESILGIKEFNNVSIIYNYYKNIMVISSDEATFEIDSEELTIENLSTDPQNSKVYIGESVFTIENDKDYNDLMVAFFYAYKPPLFIKNKGTS